MSGVFCCWNHRRAAFLNTKKRVGTNTCSIKHRIFCPQTHLESTVHATFSYSLNTYPYFLKSNICKICLNADSVLWLVSTLENNFTSVIVSFLGSNNHTCIRNYPSSMMSFSPNPRQLFQLLFVYKMHFTFLKNQIGTLRAFKLLRAFWEIIKDVISLRKRNIACSVYLILLL